GTGMHRCLPRRPRPRHRVRDHGRATRWPRGARPRDRTHASRQEPTVRVRTDRRRRRADDVREPRRRSRAGAGGVDRVHGRSRLRGRATSSNIGGSFPPTPRRRGQVVMPPLLVIARLTVQESSRRRLLLALLILPLLVVGVWAWGFNKIT